MAGMGDRGERGEGPRAGSPGAKLRPLPREAVTVTWIRALGIQRKVTSQGSQMGATHLSALFWFWPPPKVGWFVVGWFRP